MLHRGLARRLGTAGALLHQTRGMTAAASGSQRIRYRSTRGGQSNLTFSEAVLQGLGTDKGLLVPQRIPTFTPEELESWRGLSFDKLANKVRPGVSRHSRVRVHLLNVCVAQFARANAEASRWPTPLRPPSPK